MAFRSVPRPSSPPGAKASTECPSHAQDLHHAQKPSSERKPPHSGIICSAHNRSIAPARADAMDFHASERFAPSQGHPQTPGQTLRRQRPETHQNLIYPDKEQRPGGAQTAPQARFVSLHTNSADYFRFSAIHSPNPPSPLVETIGLEPTTPCLQSRCSPS
jgi:hypothetical protein